MVPMVLGLQEATVQQELLVLVVAMVQETVVEFLELVHNPKNHSLSFGILTPLKRQGVAHMRHRHFFSFQPILLIEPSLME
jgi:hypothetical protein